MSFELNQASQRCAKQNVHAASIRRCTSISITAQTRAEMHYKNKQEEHESLLGEKDSALKNLSRVRFDVAGQIGRRLIEDVFRSVAVLR